MRCNRWIVLFASSIGLEVWTNWCTWL